MATIREDKQSGIEDSGTGRAISKPDLSADGIDSETGQLESTSGTGDISDGNDPADSTVKRGRGRPSRGESGSGSRKERGNTTGKTDKKEKLVIDASLLARQIQGVHALAALKTGEPLLMLDDKEAKTLADPIAGIIKEYGLGVSTKTLLFSQLLLACFAVYAPRVVAIRESQKQKSQLYVVGE